jgi:hypothetical protein
MVVDADLGDHASIWMCLLPGAGSCRWLRCVVDPGGLQNLVRNQKKGEKKLALFLSGPTCLVTHAILDVLELHFGSGLKEFTWALGFTSPSWRAF